MDSSKGCENSCKLDMEEVRLWDQVPLISVTQMKCPRRNLFLVGILWQNPNLQGNRIRLLKGKPTYSSLPKSIETERMNGPSSPLMGAPHGQQKLSNRWINKAMACVHFLFLSFL